MEVLPHLGVDGYVGNKNTILLRGYEHFLASTEAQSNIFKNTPSLKYIMGNSKTNNDLKDNLVDSLTTYYSDYFVSVTVFVEIVEYEDTSNVSFVVDVSAADADGVSYNLNTSTVISDNVINNFEELKDEIYE